MVTLIITFLKNNNNKQRRKNCFHCIVQWTFVVLDNKLSPSYLKVASKQHLINFLKALWLLFRYVAWPGPECAWTSCPKDCVKIFHSNFIPADAFATEQIMEIILTHKIASNLTIIPQCVSVKRSRFTKIRIAVLGFYPKKWRHWI